MVTRTPDEREQVVDAPSVAQRITIRDCPDHRLALIRFARTPAARANNAEWWAHEQQDDAYRDFVQHLPAGQLWWVAPDMQLLVEAATLSLPDFPLRQSDVPDPAGVVFYASPLTGIDSRQEGQVAVNAMSWSATASRTSGQGVLLIYTWALTDQRGWVALGVASWDLGQHLANVRGDYSETHAASVVEDRRRMAALWLLASQETLATRSAERIERAAARRQRREGIEVDTLRVLRLRRRHQRSENEQGQESREWTHRWVVSGHWRNQWLPSEDRHRPTWIAPYVKGPEDKPLVLKDSVKALVQ